MKVSLLKGGSFYFSMNCQFSEMRMKLLSLLQLFVLQGLRVPFECFIGTPIPFEMFLPTGGQDLSQLSVDIVDVDADTDIRKSVNDGGENPGDDLGSVAAFILTNDGDNLEVCFRHQQCPEILCLSLSLPSNCNCNCNLVS